MKKRVCRIFTQKSLTKIFFSYIIKKDDKYNTGIQVESVSSVRENLWRRQALFFTEIGMIEEVLQEILKAEAEVEKKIRDAETEGAEIRRKADSESAARIDAAVKNARAAKQLAVKNAEMVAEKEYGEAVRKAAEECEALVSAKESEAEKLSVGIFGRLKEWQ